MTDRPLVPAASRTQGRRRKWADGGERELEARRKRQKKYIMHANKLDMASFPEGVNLQLRQSVGSKVTAQLRSQ